MRTQPYNKQQAIDDWVKHHHNLERTQYRNFKKALDTQTKNVSDYIKIAGVTQLLEHLTILVSEQPIAIAYKKCYVDCGVSTAGWTYKRIESLAIGKIWAVEEKGSPVGFFSEYWRKLMNLFYETDAANKVTYVTETTRNQIREILDDADEQRLTVSETATFLTDNLDRPEFNRNRSLVIARTESTVGANKGAALGNASSDYLTAKEWLSIVDQNTRHSHLVANGQIVGNDEDFKVGGELAQYPGDPRLSAKEAIQCRCTAVYVPILDSRGLPILK